MQLSFSQQMKMSQQMKLAPRMIQSMEILQLPIMALKERVEQELSENPVLEEPVLETDTPAQVGEKLVRAVRELVADASEAQWLERHLRRRGILVRQYHHVLGGTDGFNLHDQPLSAGGGVEHPDDASEEVGRLAANPASRL